MQESDKLNQSFKLLNIIYMGLGAGMLMSSAVFVFMVGSGNAGANVELSIILKIAVSVFASVGYIMGRYLYTTNAKKSKGETDEATRFKNYQIACIIVWASLEGPGLFASVSYLLTGNKLFLFFFAIIFLGFLFSKPSTTKFQQDF